MGIMVLPIALRRPSLKTDSCHSTMVLDHPPLVSSFTEVPNSVFKTPSRPSTHIKKILLSLESSPNSLLPKLPYLSLVLLPTHLILCKEDSKTKPPSQRLKDQRDSSREPLPTFSEEPVPLLYLLCTMRS